MDFWPSCFLILFACIEKYQGVFNVANEIIVLTTAGSLDVARRIASALVENRQAACVNIVPGIRSIYRWEGKTSDEEEWLLIIKSVSANLENVRSTIRNLHTYDLPEVIAVAVTGGDPDYLRWVTAECTGVK
jgi:periplasmic divalent cation tolerance protein